MWEGFKHPKDCVGCLLEIPSVGRRAAEVRNRHDVRGLSARTAAEDAVSSLDHLGADDVVQDCDTVVKPARPCEKVVRTDRDGVT